MNIQYTEKRAMCFPSVSQGSGMMQCGVDSWNIWLLGTGYSLAMEIPVGSAVRKESGVISPLDLGSTF